MIYTLFLADFTRIAQIYIYFETILVKYVGRKQHSTYRKRSKMHITYYIKNGMEYAKLCISIREGKKVHKKCTNLGRVLDKEKNIYQSRERGVFTYDLSTNTYGKAPSEFVPPKTSRKESLILDFGDAFFLDDFIRAKGFRAVIDAIGYGNPDTLYAMISYYYYSAN